MTHSNPVPCFSKSFDDFDELCAFAEGWSLELAQLESGAFRGFVAQATCADMNLGLGRFERHVEQRGAPPPLDWTFAVPTPDCPPFLWRGESVGHGDLLVFGAATELEAVSRRGFSVLTVSVSEQRLVSEADRLEVSAAPLLRPGAVLQVGSRAATRIVRAAAALWGPGARSRTSTLSHAVMSRVTTRLVEAVHAADRSPRDRFAPAWHETLQRARRIVESRREGAISVRELSSEVGVSERTLRRAFAAGCAISPKEYITALRMNEIRRALRRSAGDGARIHEIANRMGYWHMGQFAAVYRRQFGELPSETLARARGGGGPHPPTSS